MIDNDHSCPWLLGRTDQSCYKRWFTAQYWGRRWII